MLPDVTNMDGSNLFEEDFAEDAQMNHLFDQEILQQTIDGGGETQQTSHNVAPDFEGVSLDYIMQRLKLIKPDLLHQLKLKPFYKSYCSWEKLSNEQRNKAVSFFHKLPEPLRGKFMFCNLINLNYNTNSSSKVDLSTRNILLNVLGSRRSISSTAKPLLQWKFLGFLLTSAGLFLLPLLT
jgi:hypothetical protein